MPAQYYDKPEPSPTDSYYAIAWNDLSTERPIGMSLGQIPRSKIKQYAIEDLDLSGESLEFFIRVMRCADDLYVTSKLSPSTSDPKMIEEVPSSDAAGMHSLLRRLAPPKGSPDRFTKRKPKGEK